MSAPKCEENTFLWKAMIVCSFVMLSMLTWAASPLQKLVEKVQYKETIKAKMKVCSEMRAMLPVYENWTRQLFINGCLWSARGIMVEILGHNNDKLKQDVIKQWEDQQGALFDQANNNCIAAAAAQQEQNNMRDMIASPLYHEKMNCPAIYEEAEKLGIKEEDVQQ